jgi:hypothetical protein
MPWYRVAISYGPGHQSRCESYVYHDEQRLYPGGKQDLVHYVCEQEDISADMYPVGKVKRVAKLPEDIRRKKIKECDMKIQNALRMKRILTGRKR